MSSPAPFEITEGRFGPLLTLESAWTDDIAALVRDRGIQEVVFRGDISDCFPNDDASIVCEVPHLKALTIFHGSLNVKPIECLSELRFLYLANVSSVRLDFASFPFLEECFVTWCRAVEGVLGVKNLKDLVVSGLPKSLVPDLSELPHLHSLGILGCGAESLEPLRVLRGLRHLRLTRFRRLENTSFLHDLVNLEELWIQNCKSFNKLDSLRDLRKLKVLTLDDVGDVESLEPLSGLKELRSLVLMGRTRLLDRNMMPIKSLPNLERIFV